MIYLVQALCPERHAILAQLQDGDPGDEQQLREGMADQITRLLAGPLNPWCGICGAPRERWAVEVAATPYGTLAEAWRAARAIEDDNRRTREALDAQGRGFDSVQRN